MNSKKANEATQPPIHDIKAELRDYIQSCVSALRDFENGDHRVPKVDWPLFQRYFRSQIAAAAVLVREEPDNIEVVNQLRRLLLKKGMTAEDLPELPTLDPMKFDAKVIYRHIRKAGRIANLRPSEKPKEEDVVLIWAKAYRDSENTKNCIETLRSTGSKPSQYPYFATDQEDLDRALTVAQQNAEISVKQLSYVLLLQFGSLTAQIIEKAVFDFHLQQWQALNAALQANIERKLKERRFFQGQLHHRQQWDDLPDQFRKYYRAMKGSSTYGISYVVEKLLPLGNELGVKIDKHKVEYHVERFFKRGMLGDIDREKGAHWQLYQWQVDIIIAEITATLRRKHEK